MHENHWHKCKELLIALFVCCHIITCGHNPIYNFRYNCYHKEIHVIKQMFFYSDRVMGLVGICQID
jgi:hypothetical protein